MSNILSEMRRAEYTNYVTILNAVILIQYVPRVLQIYLSLKELDEHKNIPIPIRASFNFFLYILAGYVSFKVFLRSNFVFYFTYLHIEDDLLILLLLNSKIKIYFIEIKWKLDIYTILFLFY